MADELDYDPNHTLQQAYNLALEQGSTSVTPEHLLLALLRNEELVRRFIIKFDASLVEIESGLSALIKGPAATSSTLSPTGHTPELRRILNRYEQKENDFRKYKDSFVKQYGREYKPGPVDLFMSLLVEGCAASTLLRNLGIFPKNASAEYQKLIMNGGDHGPHIVTTAPALSEFGENLNLKALKGKLDPVIGREDELDRVIQLLCRAEKNNPVLMGPPGVGKTAIVEGLAKKINEGAVPEKLKNKNIFTLDIGALVAGTTYRGQFEERMKVVLKEIKSNPNILIFLDEMHTVVGAGAAEGSLDASTMMKTGLARGEIPCIGAVDDGHVDIIEKDQALMRRFQPVQVNEPSVADTIEILRGRKTRYEKAHEVIIPDEILPVIADLASRYVSGRYSPDKDIDIVDETGSRLYKNKKPGEIPVMSVADAEYTAAKMANLKPETVCADGVEMVRRLEGNLKKRVVNQDHAIESVVRVVKRARVGMSDPRRPIGSFLFTGPTGVGKTELVEALADEMGLGEPIRINMTEYQDSTSVKKFYGADPGYVGYDESQTLTDKVRRRSHCVILLDEIEKAHPDIFQSLLQVLDKGVMTDNKGREVRFKNAIIIMTANIRKEMLKPMLGFSTVDERAENGRKLDRKSAEIASIFSPEFRNRVDDVLEFYPLEQEHMVSIADKFMEQVQGRISRRDIDIQLDDAAKAYLARNGHDPVMGARPLGRIIDKEVIDPVVDDIIAGKIKNGSLVVFTCSADGNGGEKLTYTFNEKAKKNPVAEASIAPSVSPIAPQSLAPL